MKRIFCLILGHKYSVENADLGGKIYGWCERCGYKTIWKLVQFHP